MNKLYYYIISTTYLNLPWIYLSKLSIFNKAFIIIIVTIRLIFIYFKFSSYFNIYILILSIFILLSFNIECYTKFLTRKLLFFSKMKRWYLTLSFILLLNAIVLKFIMPKSFYLIFNTLSKQHFWSRVVLFFIVNFYIINLFIMTTNYSTTINLIINYSKGIAIILTGLSDQELRYSNLISERFLSVLYKNFKYSLYISKLKQFMNNQSIKFYKSPYNCKFNLFLVHKLININFKRNIYTIRKICFNLKSIIYLAL